MLLRFHRDQTTQLTPDLEPHANGKTLAPDRLDSLLYLTLLVAYLYPPSPTANIPRNFQPWSNGESECHEFEPCATEDPPCRGDDAHSTCRGSNFSRWCVEEIQS
ncbi:hypothetical protein TNCV_1089391 [Trichonephila clavipes]|uniref:Uncharacterized protein n=1 Tax=Trichonephila clavipes TaxID=2585209 RepID=A0A8X6T2F3_TRICX|nr:hypothetical protein TNCV_1089391 [Trichonephila clavipes]